MDDKTHQLELRVPDDRAERGDPDLTGTLQYDPVLHCSFSHFQ